MATYEKEGIFPAIIQVSLGRGKAILSGVHFEYDPEQMNEKDVYLKEIIKKLKTKNHEREKIAEHLLRRLNL